MLTLGREPSTVTVITPAATQASEFVPETLYVVFTVGETTIAAAFEPVLHV